MTCVGGAFFFSEPRNTVQKDLKNTDANQEAADANTVFVTKIFVWVSARKGLKRSTDVGQTNSKTLCGAAN